jgi:DNA-binding transcriptional ArsR family regulator
MSDQAAVLTCLADQTRREILEVLAGSAGMNAGEVAHRLLISRQGALKHLRILSDAGLVTSRRAGREVLFSVGSKPLRDTARWMTDLADQWDHQLQALKRAAEAADT